jgi:hypothetical protein
MSMAHMRIAATAETSPQSESVLTASLSPDSLAEKLQFTPVADQFSTPGPARIATVRLNSGRDATVVVHDSENLIEILAAIEPGIESALAELIRRLRIPPESIDWVRTGISRPALFPEYHLGGRS